MKINIAQKSSSDLTRVVSFKDNNMTKPETLPISDVSITEPTSKLEDIKDDKTPTELSPLTSEIVKQEVTPTNSIVTEETPLTAVVVGGETVPNNEQKRKQSLTLTVSDNQNTANGGSTSPSGGAPNEKPIKQKLSVHGLIPNAVRRKSSGNFISDMRKMSIIDSRLAGGIATPGGQPTRSRPSSKMTKYVECWGADKPFANITDSTMAKNIGLASIAMIESNLLPPEQICSDFNCFGPPRELKPVTMWYRNSSRETMYRVQPDTHFRFDLFCASIMFLSIAAIQLINIHNNIPVIGSVGATLIVLILFLYLSHYHLSSSSPHHDEGPGEVISESRAIRLTIFLISTALVATTSVFSVVS